MADILTKAEWAVMSALWEKPNQTISGIIKTVGDKQNWKYNTYATYIKRLVDKGFIAYEQKGRDKLYYPAVEKRACLLSESKEVREKIDERSTKDFLIYMIQDGGLSEDDRKELMTLLENL